MKENDKIVRSFLGQPLKVGDEVAYIKNIRTGSSTIRKCQCIGFIKDISSNGTAKIECEFCDGSYRDTTETGNIHCVCDDNDIICKITDGVTFWWR